MVPIKVDSSKVMLLLLVITLAGLYSCNMNCVKGEGPVVGADKHVADFGQIEVNVPAEVYVTIGDEPHVSIRAQENIIQAVSASVSGNTLVLKTNPCVSTNETFVIEVTATQLSGLSVNGSANVEVLDNVTADEMEIEINGSGAVRVGVSAEEIEAGINGSGDILLSGKARSIRIQINGSGDILANSLDAETARVNINGSGDVEIGVSEKLTVSVAGSGNVRYSGNPKVDSSVSGSGEVTQMN
jgi:hypothetical protein